MKLSRIGKGSATEVEISPEVTVLFSYSTPVAAHVSGRGYLRTDRHYSVTTSKHINRWIDGASTIVPQSEIDALAVQS